MGPRRALAGIGLAVSCASAALAGAPDLPRELQSRVAVDVTRCRPIGSGDTLLEAHVRVRARGTPVALPGLHCGAYDDAGAAFFLTPVTGRLSLRAKETQRFTVRFAADAAHRECGCTVRSGTRAYAGEGPSGAVGDVDAEFEALVAELSAEEAAPAAASLPELAAAGAAHEAAAALGRGEESALGAVGSGAAEQTIPPALRYERVLAPNVPLRAGPSASAAITGLALPGARIAVDRIERGWKLARTSDGLRGWLPGDASTADVNAPERVGERLAPLHVALAPGADESRGLCASLERGALGDLVTAWRIHERAVYVNALWYALAREDRDVFRTWAADCYSATHVIDALSGAEIRGEVPQAPR